MKECKGTWGRVLKLLNWFGWDEWEQVFWKRMLLLHSLTELNSLPLFRGTAERKPQQTSTNNTQTICTFKYPLDGSRFGGNWPLKDLPSPFGTTTSQAVPPPRGAAEQTKTTRGQPILTYEGCRPGLWHLTGPVCCLQLLIQTGFHCEIGLRVEQCNDWAQLLGVWQESGRKGKYTNMPYYLSCWRVFCETTL